MSFMVPQSSGATEDYSDSALTVSLEEDSDAEQENIELSGVSAFVMDRFRRSKDWRRTDEDRWLRAYRNYRGIYGPDVQFTDTEKSKAFIKVTKTKVLAAYAAVIDVLFAGGKYPIGIESRKFPTGVAGAVHYDPNAITSEKVQERLGVDYEVPRTITRPDLARDLGRYRAALQPVEEELAMGPGKTPTAMTYEPAKIAARKMEQKLQDQLGETSADRHLRLVAFEAALFGTGIIEGPFAYDKEYPRWSEEGVYDPEVQTIPKLEAVSIWDFYPDPDARSVEDSEFSIRRHRMSRSQMRSLKKRPHFRSESIELAIEMGASYEREHWEHALEDNETQDSVDRFEVIQYWGVLDTELAEEADLDFPEDVEDWDQVQVNIWICNGQILRLVLNPFTPTRIPYALVPYELNPYSIFGIGVAENMEDTQTLMNGFMRMAVDNAALSGNLLIEIDETNLVPGQDMSIYPGKIFRRQAGAPGQAIFGTKFPNVSQELFMMFDKARQLSDESTGIPSYAHGIGGVMGVGRTASGMSMLMGAAGQNTKAVVRNFDDYLLSPVGQALFAFNMQFNFDKEFAKGDLYVVPRGTESLMRNEVRSQRLLQFMQMTANPMMAPFVKYDYILRELAASMDLDEEKILNDPREAAVQAKMMAEIQSLMPQPPAGATQGASGGPPSPSDPTGNGNGNIAPGAAPEPGAAGFTGPGGGANGGNPPPQQGPGQGNVSSMQTDGRMVR